MVDGSARQQLWTRVLNPNVYGTTVLHVRLRGIAINIGNIDIN